MLMIKAMEKRKIESIYAFEMFASWDKECFTLKLSPIGCCYNTKTGFKENVQLSIIELTPMPNSQIGREDVL